MEKEIYLGIELISEYSEAFLDSLSDDGIVKEIPIFGTIISLTKITNSISNKLLIKKILTFIHKLNEYPADTINNYREKILENEDDKRKTGEALILLLDNFNNLEKPKILAVCFASYLNGEINLTEFNQISNAVQLLSVEDLKDFSNLPNGKNETILDKGLSCGFTKIHRTIVLTWESGGHLNIIISPLGEKFIAITHGKI